MRNILNKNLLRHLTFLEILYSERDWITLGNIAKRIKCSEKVLRNDIKLINDDFEPFQIDTSSRGILLTYPPHLSRDYIYQKVLSISPEFSFIERIFFNETYDLETIAEELFISSSSLKRIIKRINRCLEKYSMQIKSNPCTIIGEEENIRNLIIHYIYEKYGVYENPFPYIQLAALDQLLVYGIKKNYVLNNFPDLTNLKYRLMVNIIRLKNNHSININQKVLDNIDISILENENFCQLFKNRFHLELNKENLLQLFHSFLDNKYAFTYKQLEKKVDNRIENAHIIVPKIKKLLRIISNEINIPIQNERQIILKFYNLQYILNKPTYILHEKRRYFAENNAHELSQLIFILKKELNKFKYHKNFKWTPSFFNEAFYILITNWEKISISLKSSIPTIELGLFCDSDIAHTLLIKDIIDYQFGNLVCTHVIEELNIDAFKKASKKYDLIITNISGINDIELPIICINTVPFMSDISKIQKQIYSLIKSKFSKSVNIEF
ncbi:helix-turn-helix domain-containing protein [Bacillus cereus group sp. RP43]|uniref:helix-turn-helix domain-containing protein n=1 Tax=Bacillus cereus group sp. RP43 TaxID=3040260 RepID=UPI003396DE2F